MKGFTIDNYTQITLCFKILILLGRFNFWSLFSSGRRFHGEPWFFFSIELEGLLSMHIVYCIFDQSSLLLQCCSDFSTESLWKYETIPSRHFCSVYKLSLLDYLHLFVTRRLLLKKTWRMELWDKQVFVFVWNRTFYNLDGTPCNFLFNRCIRCLKNYLFEILWRFLPIGSYKRRFNTSSNSLVEDNRAEITFRVLLFSLFVLSLAGHKVPKVRAPAIGDLLFFPGLTFWQQLQLILYKISNWGPLPNWGSFTQLGILLSFFVILHVGPQSECAYKTHTHHQHYRQPGSSRTTVRYMCKWSCWRLLFINALIG